MQNVVSGMAAKELLDDVHDIDKRLVHMEAMMQTMKDNHLHHIETDIASMKGSIDKIDGRMFYGVIAFFFQALLISFGVIAYLANIVMG